MDGIGGKSEEIRPKIGEIGYKKWRKRAKSEENGEKWGNLAKKRKWGKKRKKK